MVENNDINQLKNNASPKDEEDIIDLTDVISDEEDIELSDYTNEASSISEEVLELDDILDNKIDIKLEDNLNNDIEINHYLDDKFVDSSDLDSALDVSKDLSFEHKEEADELEQLIADVIEDSQQEEPTYEKETASNLPESMPLSSEQIDRALTRVIKKMYADKIDSILTEVIENAVTKEIEQLKIILLEDTV